MFEATLALCIIAGILAFVNLVGAGIMGEKIALIIGAGHVLLIFVATLISCLGSYDACNICAGISGGISCLHLIGIIIWYKKREIYYEHYAIRLWSWIFIFADFTCAMICFFSIYDFLDVGIVCIVAAGISLGTVFLNKSYEKQILVLNIVFCACCVVAACLGFVMYAEYNKDITVKISCKVYEYSPSNGEVGGKIEDSLEEGTTYAVQFDFEWGNLKSLANSSEDIRIYVNFPELYPYAVEGYISDGRSFTRISSNANTVWMYTFTANLSTDKKFSSGYFIINYDNLIDLTESGATEFEIPFEVRVFKEDGEELDLIDSYEFVYTFLQNR